MQSSIEKNNKEISKLQFEEKSTNQQVSITKKSIQNSKSLINAYNKKINLYNLQLRNLITAVDNNNNKILNIKKNYKSRSINIYKKKDSNLNNFIFSANSISQAIYRIKYYNVISDINRDVLTKLNTTQLYNEKKKQEINQLLNNVDDDKKSKEKELISLDQKEKYQKTLLQKLQKEKAYISSEIQQQRKQIESLEKLRKQILEQKQQYDTEQLKQLKRIKANIKELLF